MLRLIGCSLLLLTGLVACEKRKGTLLPPRQPHAAEGHELHARTPPPMVGQSGETPEAAPQEFTPSEQDSLSKVKQSALERIRHDSEARTQADHQEPKAKATAHALYERGRGLLAKGQQSEGVEYFLASCQLGFVEACHKFAWHEERSGNPANAFRFYRIACDNGLNKSCNNIGFQLERQRKWDDALDYYARACLKQHSVSCDNLKRLRTERLQMH